jgi:hypothetical protein
MHDHRSQGMTSSGVPVSWACKPTCTPSGSLGSLLAVLPIDTWSVPS